MDRDRTPRKAGTPSTRTLDAKTSQALNAKNRGYFQNSTWWCNCTPALPAEHFRVKKPGRNNGRWFYTCQTSNADGSKKCAFFLWDEDARPREEAAVLANSTSEPVSHRNGGYGVQRGATIAGRKRSASEARIAAGRQQQQTASKRVAMAGRSDDEDAEFGLTGEDETALLELELDAAAAAAALTAGPEPTTPSHRASKTSAAGGLVTPSTVQHAAKRNALPWAPAATTITPATSAHSTGLLTPTPARTHDALGTTTAIKTPTTSTTTNTTAQLGSALSALKDPVPLSNAVFALLRTNGVMLQPNIASELSSLLHRNELRVKGLIKGRDITREGLRAKEVRVAELVARVAELEARVEVDKGVVRKLRFDKGQSLGVDAEDEIETQSQSQTQR